MLRSKSKQVFFDFLDRSEKYSIRKVGKYCSRLSYESIPDGVTRCRIFGRFSLLSRRKRTVVMAFAIPIGRALICSSSIFSVVNPRTREFGIKIRTLSPREQVRAKRICLGVITMYNIETKEDFLHCLFQIDFFKGFLLSFTLSFQDKGQLTPSRRCPEITNLFCTFIPYFSLFVSCGNVV